MLVSQTLVCLTLAYLVFFVVSVACLFIFSLSLLLSSCKVSLSKAFCLEVLTKHGMDVGSFVRHGLDECPTRWRGL